MATAKEKLIASAQKLVEKGAFEKAIKEYLRVVQEDDADVRIWLKIGDLYAKIGKKQEATDTYQRVAQFYSDQGFYLKSVAVYKQILKLEPRLVDVNQRLAELYKQLGLISDAISQYEQVAAFFHKEGKVREALVAMKQIVDLDPETVAARIKLAEMYSRENMPREAIDEFTRAAEQLKEQGRVDEYMKVAERLLFHAPENRPVTKELARLYIEKNDPRRALPKLQVVFKADPRDLDVLRLLARAFEGLEQRPKAVSVYKELARILTETGDQRGAFEVYRQIQTIEPNDPDAEQALRGQKLGAPPPRPAAAPPNPSSTGSQRPLTGSQRAQGTGAERALDSGGHRAIAAPPRNPTGRSAAEPAESPDDVVGEEIAKILSETDVYIKYNLHAKAIEHLQRVFERSPRNVAAREKLKALYISAGKKDEAILELWSLAESVDQGRARRYVREIYELDPSNARAAGILGEQVRSPNAQPHPEVAAEDDFGVSLPSEFGLPNSKLRKDDPPTRRAKTVEPVEIAEEVDLEEDLEEAVEVPESTREIGMEDIDVDNVAFDDDIISVVVDTGHSRPNSVTSVSPEDEDRFSLDADEDPAVDFGESTDAKTHFAGGPRGVATIAPALSFDAAAEDATATTSGDEFASFDDPVAPLVPPKVSAREPATDQMDAVDIERAAAGSRRGPAPAPIPDPIRGESNLEDDLDESDFFMQQALYDEARSMLASLLERYPNNPLVTAKMRELEALERGSSPGEEVPIEPMRADNVVSAQLPTDLPGSADVESVPAESPSGEPVEVTRRGVIERGVSAEDFETHYDLGIAYKEMGLIDAAVAEFRIVMKDTAREVQCLLMIGLCYIEKQMFTEAINQFKKGLYVEGITDPEALSLYYELGQAYEKVGDPREALYYYDKVQKRDEKFRDLQRRLRALRGEKSEVAERPTAGGKDVDDAFDSLLDEG